MAEQTKRCDLCKGNGDNEFGGPCGGCGGPGRVQLDGKRILLRQPKKAGRTTDKPIRDPAILLIAQNNLVDVIKSRVQRPLDRLPEGRADDLIDAMTDAIELTKVLALLREEIKHREDADV